jgi:hypothetical protein
MIEKFNRLEHKQLSPTTFKKFDEIGMFEVMKENIIEEGGKVRKSRAVAFYFVGLVALLVFLFTVIFVIRLAYSIPL